MLSFEFKNETAQKLSLPKIKKLLVGAGRYLKIKNAVISLAFVTPAKIKKLNSHYRHKNKPTDVLSFIYEYSQKNLDGEIIICPAIVKVNARQYHLSFDQELQKVLVHSLLHLVGHDDKTLKQAQVMEKLGDKIIRSLGPSRLVSPPLV
jgi:probable rRNA maturation factor